MPQLHEVLVSPPLGASSVTAQVYPAGTSSIVTLAPAWPLVAFGLIVAVPVSSRVSGAGAVQV